LARTHYFRLKPGEWNEEQFVFFDRSSPKPRATDCAWQLCLSNWWRDTAAVTQYLRWAGIDGADDDNILRHNKEKAMLFIERDCSPPLSRTRRENCDARNTVSGVMYRTIHHLFELMNEAQC